MLIRITVLTRGMWNIYMCVCMCVCVCVYIYIYIYIYIYTIIVDLHFCMAETNTIFLQLKNKI